MEFKRFLLTYKKNSLCRNQCVDLDHTKFDIHEVHCGIPQGSVMGPLLFNIFNNDIVDVRSLFDLSMYADDITLISTLETFSNRKTPPKY